MINDEASARAWLKTLPEYDAAAEARLELLCAMLLDENKLQNLVSAGSVDHIWQRHIADSAQLLTHVPRETSGPWLDLGTGAGFPGLVVAILRPTAEFCLVEGRPRRAAWLGRVCRQLELPHACVIPQRLEQVATRRTAVISARAFAPLDRLLELSARFCDGRTLWLLPKGASAAHELSRLSGWLHMFHVEQSMTDRNAGIIVGHLGAGQGK